MSDDYYTYTEQLVAEGRRVFALVKARELADDRDSRQGRELRGLAQGCGAQGQAGPGNRRRAGRRQAGLCDLASALIANTMWRAPCRAAARAHLRPVRADALLTCSDLRR